jgi:hypothetical protein
MSHWPCEMVEADPPPKDVLDSLFGFPRVRATPLNPHHLPTEIRGYKSSMKWLIWCDEFFLCWKLGFI